MTPEEKRDWISIFTHTAPSQNLSVSFNVIANILKLYCAFLEDGLSCLTIKFVIGFHISYVVSHEEQPALCAVSFVLWDHQFDMQARQK